jgi:aminopeptidase
MPSSHDERLRIYSELAVRIGLNLQPGQRLLIIGPLASGGASLEAAPLIRRIAATAYQAGASLVETLWGDEAQLVARFEHAPPGSFGEASAWLPGALLQHVQGGGAVLSVYANNPDLLKNQPVDLVGAVQQATSRSVVPFRECISRNQTNWTVIAAAAGGWAEKIFPGLRPHEQVSRLWDAIAALCRLDGPDPVTAWEEHLASLAARRDYLIRKQYSALRYRGPGTDLTLGLPRGHLWASGRATSQSGIPFTANLPTEEVFSIVDKDRVDGTVRSTKPLSYAGTLIENFALRFEHGRVVGIEAERGAAVLRQLVDTDPGAARLGEVALVPHSSPVSQSGVLFYNTLFDENAASHVALGAAYRFTLAGGETMTDEEFAAAGGNTSATHVDFMIGSADLDIDGVLPDGQVEPLIRGGDWAIADATTTDGAA